MKESEISASHSAKMAEAKNEKLTPEKVGILFVEKKGSKASAAVRDEWKRRL